jgi:GAF domain-containing protein
MRLNDKRLADELGFIDQEAQNFVASMSEKLTHQVDFDTMMQVMMSVARFLNAEELSIFVVDEATGDAVLMYATGEVGAKIIGIRLKVGQGVVGWVIKYNEDLIVPYPGMDTRFFEGVDKSTGFTTRSILCCPLRVSRRAVGAVEAVNKIDGTFNDDDLILLRAIARLIVDAIPINGV